MFLIENKQVCGLGWPRPGLLLLVDGRVRLTFYDTVARKERLTFATHPGRAAYTQPRFVLSPNGRWLVLEEQVWDLEPTLAALASDADVIPPPTPLAEWPRPDVGWRRGVAFTTSGRLGAWQGPNAYVARDLPGFQIAVRCPCQAPMQDQVWLSDEFLVRLEGKTAAIHALSGGDLRVTLPHTQPIIAGTFSRDGRLLATAAGVTVRVWDPHSGECIQRFKGQRGHVQAVAFHPSGEVVGAPCPDGAVRFWSVVSGREVASYLWGARHHYGSSLAFSPDGQTAAVSWGDVAVWDVDH
jgi:WD40 repeat protein